MFLNSKQAFQKKGERLPKTHTFPRSAAKLAHWQTVWRFSSGCNRRTSQVYLSATHQLKKESLEFVAADDWLFISSLAASSGMDPSIGQWRLEWARAGLDFKWLVIHRGKDQKSHGGSLIRITQQRSGGRALGNWGSTCTSLFWCSAATSSTLSLSLSNNIEGTTVHHLELKHTFFWACKLSQHSLGRPAIPACPKMVIETSSLLSKNLDRMLCSIVITIFFFPSPLHVLKSYFSCLFCFHTAMDIISEVVHKYLSQRLKEVFLRGV